MSGEKKRKPQVAVKVIKGSKAEPVVKADMPTQVDPDDGRNSSDWISPPLDQRGLARMVRNSTILPQCIRAYKNNIAGFGISVQYKDDSVETPEMSAEFSRMEEVIELLNIEQDTKEVFEDLIETRETYGIAYLEVVRNIAGEVVQIEHIPDVPSILKSKPLPPYEPMVYYHHGQAITRMKKFRKYKQEEGGKTVYFKEFGDPRIMDWRSGKYLEDGETLDLMYQANEIMDFPIGTKPYGEVRWIGQVLGIDGAHRAESLNNNYFINGRHTPLMIMIQNGTLTDESFAKLNEYMDDIKGESGQHAFILLETESTDKETVFETSEKPNVEIKDLASILQKDELFQDYQENGRKRVQSAFLLPDLYVAYTTDFNRATADTAQKVTENQVFQPERKSLAWQINNRLLNAYQWKYCECVMNDPDITNPDDVFKLLSVGNQAGGMSPNMAKEIICDALGKPEEDFPEDIETAPWADLPISFRNTTSGGFGITDLKDTQDDANSGENGQDEPDSDDKDGAEDGTGEASTNKKPRSVDDQLDDQIKKAQHDPDAAIVAVMKEVKAVLKNMEGGTGDVPVLREPDKGHRRLPGKGRR